MSNLAFEANSLKLMVVLANDLNAQATYELCLDNVTCVELGAKVSEVSAEVTQSLGIKFGESLTFFVKARGCNGTCTVSTPKRLLQTGLLTTIRFSSSS